MKRSPFIVAVLFFISFSAGRSQTDTAAFRSAVSSPTSSEKVAALTKFLGAFPASSFRGSAYNALFGLYVQARDESRALDAAAGYIGTLAPESRMNPYNSIAYALALNSMGLDTAFEYAARAEAMAKSEGGSALGPIQDTRAFVLYRKGDFTDAEKLQTVAIRGHEDDPEYVGHLAVYQEACGERRLALATISRAIYLGGDREQDGRFADWLAREVKEGRNRDALKDSIVMSTVHGYIDTVQGVRVPASKSAAAAYMARMSVNLDAARAYAEAAASGLTPDSPVEDAVLYKQNLALVEAARGKYTEALGLLRSIEDLASPWSTDFWLALGGICGRLGEDENAVAAYMNGLTAVSSKELRDTLESAYRKLHGSVEGLDGELERVKRSGAEFNPGRYEPEGKGSGKVMLAEIFTGAECNPCVASDVAFDALGEYFPRTDLSILEYHVHIPGPDPLTTNDSWARYQMYGGRGTPTVVIDGRESILGGGPKFIARNRFNLYRYAIRKHIADSPGMSLAIGLAKHGDSVEVQARVGGPGGRPKPDHCVLHVALVQKSADYTGANGISRHAMVVRALLGGPGGTPVSAGGGEETIRLSVNMGDVESALREIIRDPKGQPSWPGRKRNFTAWRSVPVLLDRSNLTVVAWIQNPATREVLQSASRDVPAGEPAN